MAPLWNIDGTAEIDQVEKYKLEILDQLKLQQLIEFIWNNVLRVIKTGFLFLALGCLLALRKVSSC